MTGTRLWQRRREEPRALEALLGDMDTVDAAESAFAAAGRDDAPWWPCAAVVDPETVTVRLAGLKAPEPEAPWRAGHEPHVWTADRGELTAVAPGRGGRLARGRLLLIGRHQDSVVFVDTTRATGPLEVTGDAERAERVRGLIDGQSRGRPADARAQGGAHWPAEVRDDVIVLIGLPVATVLSEEDSRLAAELMLRAANRVPSDDVDEPESSAGTARGDHPGREQTLDDWLRRVNEAADRDAPPQHEAEAQPQVQPQAQPIDTPPEAAADHDAFAFSAAEPAPAARRPEPTAHAPRPPAEASAQAPDTEDWTYGFAVSSAAEQAHR